MKRIICICILLLISLPVFGQNNIFDLRSEFNSQQVTYHNLLYDRLEGDWLFELAHVRLPESQYTESSVGVGYNVFATLTSDVICYPVVHYTTATDDNYFQPSILVSKPVGKFTASIFTAYYVPLGDNGITQVVIDPLEIQYNVFDKITFGLSLYYWHPEIGDPLTKIGPKIGLLDELGVTEIRLAKNMQAETYEIQLRRFITF